jgi:hypothetical protein
MKTTIKIKGKVLFDPPEKTKKHRKQAVWKKVAYLNIKGDVCAYYAWFIKKRFNLPLARPLRGAHITFINDSLRDMGDKAKYWDDLKGRWSGVEIEVELHLEPKTNDISWWLTVVEESRNPLHDIRAEIGLGRPHWGLHMTIGDAQISTDDSFENGVEKATRDNIAHSKYIHELAKKGLI